VSVTDLRDNVAYNSAFEETRVRAVEATSTSEIHRRPSARGWATLLDKPVMLALLLVLATLAVYYPVHGHPFVRYDDNDYIYENLHVQAGMSWHTVKWALTTSTASNWHPVTWMSHALDCQLFGLNPAGPHDENLLLHALNAVLLFWVLLRATGYAGRSFMVAALFALHPINVESVAWIAERKNMLSMMFFLLALGAYRWYVSKPGAGRYAVVALLFAVGLMAKPQIITFPFVLLLWDYWPLGRMFSGNRQSLPAASSDIKGRSLLFFIWEKVPLFCIAAASALITMKAQHGARSWFPRPVRGGNAVLSYGLYLKKLVWPTGLAPMYPHPGASLRWSFVVSAGLILTVITILVILGRRHRYLPVGWFWFLGTLVPMIGIIQVGIQAMADRYAYVSFLGLFIMICWGVADWAQEKQFPAALLPAVSCALLLTLGVTTRHQLDYWRTDVDLWTHTLQVTSRNSVAESELGTALAIDGKVEEAVPHFYNAIAIAPSDYLSHMGIAIYEMQRRNYAGALMQYKEVVKNQSGKPNVLMHAYTDMARAYRALGDNEQAQACLQQASKLRNQ
jgi:hypothetical protein